ncbi:SusD/RagB family nutrient-binding outer membrane lipoprotein [Pontibacter harenae]|uniref:SusD/RagB family nutrient-binding outer membrane lipoprotein n=1 Tax=Pontibacter harenae TaxID=2894083 RepID=UPI001E4F4A47|nr:SusD/RagB family nutrient-binding outer membrane lipoprotein [Pontibacter harenae]MCC9168683.1 SusD/RagB family nutrient-binding outer membrane lipoprotein [Pontibacter harenae]
MKRLLIYLLPLVLMVSCVDDLEDYNIDRTRATQVPSATLFTGAVKNLTDVLTTPNVNINNYRFYVQYWTSTQYLDEPRYNMTSRLIPQNIWQTLYRDVLADLNEAEALVQADDVTPDAVKSNQMAQIEIMQVYAWSVLVNTFGDVPYSQALDPDIALPAYDDAQTVYNSILDSLDVAIQMINTSEEGFSDGDLLYEGQMTDWYKFGNSLKLRLAMVIADVDPEQAETLVEEAAPNVFTSNEDNAAFPYLSAPPNNNPISANLNPLFTSRQDYVAANTLVDVMNELDDPRRQFYFTQVNGEYIGGEYGFPNTYANFSTVNPTITDPTFEALLLDYAEVEFLLAEAVERGFDVAGTAEQHYNNGVRASILYWGGTEAEATAYLSQPEVNYNTAADDWREKIGLQKWLALYNRGFTAWVEWRRLDAPELLPPNVEGAGTLSVPTRLIYPINEQTLNGANRAAAAAAIGGDERTTRLFWDVR